MKRAMMIHGLWRLAVAVLALGIGIASSQPAGAAADNAAKPRDVLGEWERAGAGFACKVGPAARIAAEAIKPVLLTRACLHMGPFVIGEDAQVLKTAFGPPPRTMPQPNGAIGWVYFLDKPEQYPYLVATISKNRIHALQVTGPVAATGYTYNHIDLGAATDTLVQYFGQPSRIEPSEEKDTDLWTYAAQPFSFEVRGGHVTSIRIREP